MSAGVRPRSWLFVPADRPDRFPKAQWSGADVVIMDLEDAVAPARKIEARTAVVEALTARRTSGPMTAVRMNALGSVEGLGDLAALAQIAIGRLDFIVVPKTEGPHVLRIIGQVLDQAGSGTSLVGLIETPRGVAIAAEAVEAVPRLAGLMFGAADYAAALGRTAAELRPDHARAVIANSAAIGGVLAIDTPFFAIGEADALAAECQTALNAGFSAKAAIHPVQVETINACFSPPAEALAQARRILETQGAGASQLDGRMVDAAMVRWALRVTGAS